MSETGGGFRAAAQGAAVKALIFDCDGVLIDSRAANAAFYNRILSCFGKPALTEAEAAYVHCHTVDESLAYLFRGDQRLKEARRLWPQLDYKPILRLIELQPGLRQWLPTFRRRFRLAVATNRTTTMPALLRHFELQACFDLVVTALDVERPKPHPESLLKIAAHFGIEPGQAWYIGDSDVDQATAAAAGMPFVAYRNQYLQADLHVDSYAELAAALGIAPETSANP